MDERKEIKQSSQYNTTEASESDAGNLTESNAEGQSLGGDVTTAESSVVFHVLATNYSKGQLKMRIKSNKRGNGQQKCDLTSSNATTKPSVQQVCMLELVYFNGHSLTNRL